MGTWNFLSLLTKNTITSALIGVTISDLYTSITHVKGASMHPTFHSGTNSFPGSLTDDLLLVEKFCLRDYKFSHGDVIIFRSPNNHKETFVKRLIALPGDWIQIPDSYEILKIPEGRCWVEGDNSANSLDSRYFGPIPLGLIQGRVTHVIWPPNRVGKVERRIPAGRISNY
ncbi:peptidase S24/S26A/S26B/S26C family protein [Tasmannia lanceolata]|uniref:peptidase S24/S26A/S26B/S26C family protein n=1 Tax=Tasmannia lanceolata TaxID=3420 RepID=UPI0040632B68